jgi:hypothetical protein
MKITVLALKTHGSVPSIVFGGVGPEIFFVDVLAKLDSVEPVVVLALRPRENVILTCALVAAPAVTHLINQQFSNLAGMIVSA